MRILSNRVGRFLQRVLRLFRSSAKEPKFLVTCKGCGRKVPIGTEQFPFQSVLIVCCLCREAQRYRPSEIEFGVPDELVHAQEKAEKVRVRRMGNSTMISVFH